VLKRRFNEEVEKEPAVGRLLDIAQKLEGLYGDSWIAEVKKKAKEI